MFSSTLLAADGCDRATAYHMSNKIARLNGRVFVTWLNSQYRSILAQVDPASGALLNAFPLAKGCDNHCGAGLAVTPDNVLHMVSGSHASGGFIYRYSATPEDPGSWSLPESAGSSATYPSLVACPDGSLLLAYRHTVFHGRWGVMLQRRSPDGQWSWPHKIMHAASDNYIYPTNSLTIDAEGTVHLAIEFYKTYPVASEYARSTAITRLFLPAGADKWFHDDGRRIDCAPVGIEDSCLIEHDPTGDLRPGNIIVLRDGRPALCSWNARTQELNLLVRDEAGWSRHNLNSAALAGLEGWSINSQGRLTLAADGSVLVVTTVSADGAWGAGDQQLCILEFQPETAAVKKLGNVAKEDPARAAWLPAVEHPNGSQTPGQQPLVIYTDGNKGNGCVNTSLCNVRLLSL